MVRESFDPRGSSTGPFAGLRGEEKQEQRREVHLPPPNFEQSRVLCRAYQFYNRCPTRTGQLVCQPFFGKSLRSSFWQSYATNTHLTRHYFYHNLGELISPGSMEVYLSFRKFELLYPSPSLSLRAAAVAVQVQEFAVFHTPIWDGSIFQGNMILLAKSGRGSSEGEVGGGTRRYTRFSAKPGIEPCQVDGCCSSQVLKMGAR
jgi:hypothetical protein